MLTFACRENGIEREREREREREGERERERERKGETGAEGCLLGITITEYNNSIIVSLSTKAQWAREYQKSTVGHNWSKVEISVIV